MTNPNKLADALDCFWNAALDGTRQYDDATANAVMNGMVQGFAAVAARLREHDAQPAPAPVQVDGDYWIDSDTYDSGIAISNSSHGACVVVFPSESHDNEEVAQRIVNMLNEPPPAPAADECLDCAYNPGLCDEHDNGGKPLHPPAADGAGELQPFTPLEGRQHDYHNGWNSGYRAGWNDHIAAIAALRQPVTDAVRELLVKARDRAKVFDDGSDGADAESARSVVALLESALAS